MSDSRVKYLFFFLLALVVPASVYGEIFVHDALALRGEEILITAETRKGYFAKGGKIVEFSMNGKSIGRVLSGGDGVAYKIFRTGRQGMHRVVAGHGKDTGSGDILVLKKGGEIVFIDVEGSLLAAPFTKKPIERSRKVIRKIMNSYPVVYLHTGEIGIRAVKKWLRQNKFPAAPVLPWQTGNVFTELNNKGLRIKAVIGSQVVIDSANAYNPAVFGFDEQDRSENLKVWQEIEKKLR